MMHDPPIVYDHLSAQLADEIFPRWKTAPPMGGDLPFRLLARAAFTSVQPRTAEMMPMAGVNLVTLHHSGFSEGFFEDSLPDTAKYLEYIRQFHAGGETGQRGWADIGYHFAVDRAGRIWQLRPLQWQGAHVKNHNGGNMGIVALGNFDLQVPPDPLIAALCTFTDWLRRIYELPGTAVHIHGSLADEPTSCPGSLLKKALEHWAMRDKAAV